MRLIAAVRDAWRKNAPELVAWWNGALPSFVTARRPHEPLPGVPVFCYHLVEAGSFEADLEYLRANGYRTVSSDELIEHLAGVRVLSARSVVLTFDDGPRNFYDVAFPLLKRFQARAVAFIAPGLHADAGPDDAAQARPMTWQELRTVHASGLVELQSHTFESRFVPRWPAPAALAGCAPALERGRRRPPLSFGEDLAASRREIEKRLPGARVDQLAFPMYLGTPSAVQEARSLGFRACYWGLVEGRPLNRAGDGPFHVSRISDEFVRRLPGAGRITTRQMLRERLHRVEAGRAWRRKYAHE